MGNKNKSQHTVPEIIDLDRLSPQNTGTYGGKACGLAQLLKALIASGGQGTIRKAPAPASSPSFRKNKRRRKSSRWPGGPFTAPRAAGLKNRPQNKEERSAFTLISHLVLCEIPRKTFINFKKVGVPTGFAVSATTLPVEQWSAETRDEFIDKVQELLEHGPIVCRSSAIGEDSAEKSFAGMFETVLNITNEKEALAAADRCIASGKSERVRKYAGSNASIPVGLVVQQQVAALAAGVCFTIDPIGKDRAVVIEAVPGLGDKMVSGQVEPERFRVYRSGTGNWEIYSSQKDYQKFFRGVQGPHMRGEAFSRCAARVWETECRDGPEGLLEKFLVPPFFKKVGRRRHTREAGIIAIAAGAKELAEQFGYPLDLEWAIDESYDLWWLQARPITAAADPPEYIVQPACADADDGPITVRSNWNVRETMPEPLFPFTWTFWRDRLLPVITTHLAGISRKSHLLRYSYPLDLVHGRIYFNLNAMLAAPLIGSITPRLIATVDSRAGSTIKELKKKGILRPRKYPGSRLRLFFSMLKAGFISFIKIFRWLNPQKSMRILAEDSQTIARRKALHLLSDRELVEEFDLWARPGCSRILYGLQMELLAMVIYVSAKKAFKKHPEALDLLCTGIPANPTTKISIEIEELKEAAEHLNLQDIFLASLPTAQLFERLQKEKGGKEWLDKFNLFITRNGHRGPMEFDLGSTRWSDDPTMIIETIRSGLRNPDREKLTSRLHRLAKKRADALEKATAASFFLERPLMRWLARKVEAFMPLREAPKHYAVIVFQRIRQAALELGKRLADRGILPAAGDVFFLEVEELVKLANREKVEQARARSRAAGDRSRLGIEDIPGKLKERRQLYDRFKNEKPPGFFRSDGVPVFEENDFSTQSDEGILRGTAISAGSAAGPVRILTEPDPSLVQEGDIIVMEYADPGWTPLFPLAAGIVMEVGGLMCHAAVVARELGIPAVFGIADAATILKTGRQVKIDGTTGTVALCHTCKV